MCTDVLRKAALTGEYAVRREADLPVTVLIQVIPVQFATHVSYSMLLISYLSTAPT